MIIGKEFCNIWFLKFPWSCQFKRHYLTAATRKLRFLSFLEVSSWSLCRKTSLARRTREIPSSEMKRFSNVAFLQACLMHSSFCDLHICVDINWNASQHFMVKHFNSYSMSSSVVHQVSLHTQREVTKKNLRPGTELEGKNVCMAD